MKRMFWLDMEMTGLDVESCAILEVAAIVTDLDLNPLDEYTRVVQQPQAVLDGMDDWCVKTHGESGLTAEVPAGTPLDQVETDLLALLDRHFKPDERVVLCGNSIHQDRLFVNRYVPRLAARLHYRMVDVSSFKEMFRSKYGIQWEKANNHRALQDTRESIRELAEYLRHVQPPTASDRERPA
ncbi:MAG TPA: oligoribonuclease [bacterium]|jgi:oligoribonuclease